MTDSPHPEQATRFRELQARYKSSSEEVARLETERGEAMYAGRLLVPPLTFRELADIFEVTVGAVQARCVKEEAKR